MLLKEDATWRNIEKNNPAFKDLKNFNHDAFVYKWDTAACTLQDFKLNIKVIAAREAVSKKMTDVMETCLKTKSATYENDIKDAFKRGEANMYNTIESYKK